MDGGRRRTHPCGAQVGSRAAWLLTARRASPKAQCSTSGMFGSETVDGSENVRAIAKGVPMNIRSCAWLVPAALVLVPGSADAQEECPVARVGLACDAGIAGTCIRATCTETVDGSMTTRDCGACVVLPPESCNDAGQPCGDGGLCASHGGAGGGGGPSGGPSVSIGYSYAACEYPGGAGATGAGTGGVSGTGAGTGGIPPGGGGIAPDDGAVTENGGSPSGSADASMSTHGGSAPSPDGSGCGVSKHTQGPFGGLASAAAAIVMCRRRRSTKG